MDFKGFSLLRSLTDDQIQGLKGHMQTKTIPKAETAQLNAANKIYLVRHGLVKLQVENTVEYVKYVYKKGDIFHVLPLLGKSESTVLQLLAEENTIIISIEIAPLHKLLQENRHFLLDVLQLAAHRIQKAENHIRFLHAKKAKDRIVGFLTLYIAESSRKEADFVVNENVFTHQEIAEITCTSRQTVSDTLNQLKRDGLLYYNQGFIGLKQAYLSSQNEYNMS